jgi:hypothetical protein
VGVEYVVCPVDRFASHGQMRSEKVAPGWRHPDEIQLEEKWEKQVFMWN